MSNNTYTFSALKQAVTHVLGGNPDQNLTADQVVNGALANFANGAPWRWRQRALSIGSTNAQNFINLPADFQELVTVKKVGDLSGCTEPVTIDKITELRQTNAGTYAGLAYCLDWTPQTSSTAEPQPIIQIYPTPNATTNPYLVGTYLRQIPKLVGATDLPDVPATFHELLLIWVRAYATMLETGQFGADWTMFENMYPRYAALDGRSAGSPGRMRGGLSQSFFGPSLTQGPITTS